MRYLVFGKEVAPTTGTPHLQGCVQFLKSKRFKEALKYLEDGSHIEIMKGNLKQASDYCKKEGDFEEFGELVCAGKRCDIDRLRDAIADGERSAKTLRRTHNVAVRYPNLVQVMLADYAPPVRCPDILLHPWQEELYAILRIRCTEEDRSVHFIIDPKGAGGKSKFCQYLEASLGSVVQVMDPGPYAEMAYILEDQIHILVMDVPRSAMEFLQYRFLENVKNGRVMSTKYQPISKRLGPVHVVVMCNEKPNWDKLSHDRIIETNI